METIPYTNKKSERLDKFLVNEIGEYSRSQWQKVIKNGFVLVNDERVPAKHKLESGDTITINQVPTETTVDIPDMDIPIVAETDDYIVIDKPSGLPVHPDSKYKTNTLIQQIVKKYPDIKNVDPDSDRPGIVHRLDKDVSGVMVIARTAEMFDALKTQFQKRNIHKAYHALVHGVFQKQRGELEVRIERNKKTGKMVVRPKNQTGKIALTEYEVLQQFTHFTYLNIIIKTGRTHQIRAVMQALNHPIVGDTLYDKKKVKANIAIDRPFLHAHTLTFHDMSAQEQTFTSELPPDLHIIIESLS